MGKIRNRKTTLLCGSALALVISGGSGALAQTCSNFDTPIGNLAAFAGLTAAASASIGATIGNVNTAFLGQQGSAFVANPGGGAPDQQSGGVWVRGVGGEVEVKSTTNSSISLTSPPGTPLAAGTVNCSSREHASFGGVQVGTDIARLDVNGWNFNLGTTTGYLESTARERNTTAAIPGPPRTKFQVPFLGAYAVMSKGSFFADLMIRGEYYNIEIDNPGANFFDQPISARGISVSASAGYQMQLANDWFVEPSAGFSWSRTTVDPFTLVGLPPNPPIHDSQQFSGTVAISDIESKLGRASLRVGTSLAAGNLALQPFVTGSLFHEFAGNISSIFQTCDNCVRVGANPASINTQSSGSRIGTYGQISLGMAGQVVDTGWVGFVRGDYRTGSNIVGWTANAGVRYNFVPAPPPTVSKMIVKAAPAPVVTAVNWSGLYVGGFFGADYGNSRVSFFDVSTGPTGTAVDSRPKLAGYIVGGQAGYNYQTGPYVLGVEGDIGATNKHGSRACGSANAPNPGNTTVTGPLFFTCSNDLDWVATFAGRLGVTWERALLYVKGGAAWTQETFAANCILGPNNNAPDFGGGRARTCLSPAGGGVIDNFGASTDRFGYVLGFGTEFALNNTWSVKAEYDYINYGSKSIRLSDGTQANLSTRISEVKVGLNYHLQPMSP